MAEARSGTPSRFAPGRGFFLKSGVKLLAQLRSAGIGSRGEKQADFSVSAT